MGLFSSFGKNKQEASGEDSGYYRAQDDKAATERAKSKRASNAGGGATRGRAKDDPVLPEKKRARRRLVGAIALALAVAVGLPMVLDSEPKPLASDIAIQIPSKDKPAEPLGGAAPSAAPAPAPVEAAPAAAPLPVAAAPVAPVHAPAQAAAKAPVAHSPAATLDKGEEFIDVPKPKPADTHIAKASEHKPEPKKPELKEAKPEPKAEPKPEHKAETRRPEPAKAAPPNDDARAMAILEGKPAEAATKYVIQVGAFATQDKVEEVQNKLKAAGIKSFVQKVSTAAGERTRVRVGPFSSKDEADKARAKLGKIGLDGSLIPA